MADPVLKQMANEVLQAKQRSEELNQVADKLKEDLGQATAEAINAVMEYRRLRRLLSDAAYHQMSARISEELGMNPFWEMEQ